MHALLALGASHLTLVSPHSDYSTMAIVHRGQAIKGLNEALAKSSRGYGESDALLAACYALTFQASYMGDGMADFITMVRGCALVTEQINKDQSQTAFNVQGDIHLRLMEPKLGNLPTIDPSLITPAIISAEAFRPLLRTTMDQHFHAALLSVLFALQESSRAGYLNFIRVYGTFTDMSHDQFNVFIESGNIPSQLLMAHFIALQMLVAPLIHQQWPERAYESKAEIVLGIVEWGQRIFERASAETRVFLEWPKGVCDAVAREVAALREGTHRSLGLKILVPDSVMQKLP
jgi:hypothetical protein